MDRVTDVPQDPTQRPAEGPPTGPRAGAQRADAQRAGAKPPAYVVAGDKARVLSRLRRVEGQVRGLQRMVDEDTYCIDVLTQISAATSALESVALQLLDEHLQHCVRHAVEDGSQAEVKLAEASAAVARLVRS